MTQATVYDALDSVNHSINNGSYNTLDFLFNVIMSSMVIGAFIFVIWMAYSFIKIERDSR